MGISYAKAQRFKKPEIVPFKFDQLYTKTGPASIQLGNTDWLQSEKGTSEDCLNLNIWAPIDKEDTLPVVVYIHGGGFQYGSNSQDTSNLSGLVSSGKVIGVSINYRLGANGWLSLSQYGGALKDATNLGLQDVIVALEWIQKNIQNFGGNPNNVTVSGHSAGAFISLALLSTPTAKGKFHQIAAFSGGASRIVPQWWAEELTYRVLKDLGHENEPEKILTLDNVRILESLQKVSIKDIFERNSIDNPTLGIVNDSKMAAGILEKHPMDVLNSYDNNDVTILFSSTSKEVDWWKINDREDFDPQNLEKIINDLVIHSRVRRTQAQKIVDFYSKSQDPIGTRSALLTDYIYTLPQTRAAIAHASSGGRCYLLNIGSVKGAHAVHGTEMYGIVGQKYPNSSTEQLNRDNFVTKTIINLATNNFENLWAPIKNDLFIQEIGHSPYKVNNHTKEMLKVFEDISRP